MFFMLLLLVIKEGCFVLVFECGQLVFYMSWVDFDEVVEVCYLQYLLEQMWQEDWSSGECLWIFDWIVFFGYINLMMQLVCKCLMVICIMCIFYYCGVECGMCIMELYGMVVYLCEVCVWFVLYLFVMFVIVSVVDFFVFFV